MGTGPAQRVKYVTSSLVSTSVVDVIRGETHWHGTESTRPLHVGGIAGSIAHIYEPRLPEKFKNASTLDDKIQILRDTPEWMKKNDLDVKQLSPHAATAEQRQQLRQVLNRDQYKEYAVASLDHHEEIA